MPVRISLSLLISLCCTLIGYCQLPAGWSVDTTLYQYRMTVTGVISNNCQFENNHNNAIAAFVNGQCRGVVSTNVTNGQGKALGFLTVYSNTSTGEKVDFKCYIQSSGTEIAAIDSLSFVSNSSQGTVANPFLITNNHAPNNLSISNHLIYEDSPIGSLLGTLNVTEPEGQNVIYSLSGNGPDNQFFTINSNDLLVDSVFNMTVQDSFIVVIQTTDDQGCSYLDSLQIVIQNTPNTPADIYLDSISLYENNEFNYLVGHFSTLDFDNPNDSFTYTLVSGNNDSDNPQFTIIGNELYLKSKAIYEIKETYHIRVRCTDSQGLSFEKIFDIQVLKIENLELPLPAAAYISNNNDGKNDFFVIQNVEIYNHFELEIFDQFGQKVFHKDSNYTNEFDGKKDGQVLPGGTYYYLFRSEKKTFKGYLTIVN